MAAGKSGAALLKWMAKQGKGIKSGVGKAADKAEGALKRAAYGGDKLTGDSSLGKRLDKINKAFAKANKTSSKVSGKDVALAAGGAAAGGGLGFLAGDDDDKKKKKRAYMD